MPERLHICVFCGSSPGSRASYSAAAERVGRALAIRGLGLVYGGGQVGLMGVLADAALRAGGRVVGVIPESLAGSEVAHHGLTELHVVAGMHERKALMATRSAAFMVLPGGVGTFEELFEILSWAVLGLHNKPIGLLDIDGYLEPLVRLLEHAVAEGFLRPEHFQLLRFSTDPEAIVEEIQELAQRRGGARWIGPDGT